MGQSAGRELRWPADYNGLTWPLPVHYPSHSDGWVPGGSVPRASIPRGRKQKLPGHVRAMLATGTVSLPPYSNGPTGHSVCPQSRRRKKRIPLDGGVAKSHCRRSEESR